MVAAPDSQLHTDNRHVGFSVPSMSSRRTTKEILRSDAEYYGTCFQVGSDVGLQ